MRHIRPIGVPITLAMAISGALTIGASPAQAWTFKTLYQFTGATDGNDGVGGLLRDQATGDLYGVTQRGGNLNCDPGRGCGVVYKLASDGTQTVLHTFNKKTNGLYPAGGLVNDESGNLYGTTASGGNLHACYGRGCGVIFKLTPAGAYTVLYRFQGDLGGGVETRLVRDASNGDLYGVTPYTNDNGSVFKLSKGGVYTVLHVFSDGAGGGHPQALLRDGLGNLYGTTRWLGDAKCGCGTIFQLSPDGTMTVLYTFNRKRRGYPSHGLALDSSGNLYGAGWGRFTYSEATGSVFRLASDGKLTTLHLFDRPDGVVPEGDLVVDPSGTIYGTTWYGGEHDKGTLFQIEPDRTEQNLYSFDQAGKYYPIPSGVIADGDGNLYGVTETGGLGYGYVFELMK